MRAPVLSLLLVGVALVAGVGPPPAGASVEPRAVPPKLSPCAGGEPCLFVTPDPRFFVDEMAYTYVGQGWRPGRVDVTYTPECGPECDPPTTLTTATADAQGRFAFGLTSADGGARPSTVRVSQRHAGRTVRRRPAPLPARPTPRQQREARSVARAVTRAKRALDANVRAASLASARATQAYKRCAPSQDEVYETEARAEVTDWVFSLAVEEAWMDLKRPHLRTFVERLDRLRIRDPQLAATADAWRAAVATPVSWTVARACAAMREWRSTGYDPARAPLDPEALPPTLDRLVDVSTVIASGGARLRALGVDFPTAAAFGGRRLYLGPSPFAGRLKPRPAQTFASSLTWVSRMLLPDGSRMPESMP